MQTLKKILPPVLVAAEFVFFLLIVVFDVGNISALCYASVAAAFLFTLVYVKDKKNNYLISLALLFTLAADFFLVVLGDQSLRWAGLTVFVVVQATYAVYLSKGMGKKRLVATLSARGGLTVAIIVVALAVLGSNADYLGVVSAVYVVNLFCNIVISAIDIKKYFLLFIGLVLFILCDVSLGLAIAEGTYFSYPTGSLIYNYVHSGVNTTWLFYIPSQTLIALFAAKKSTSDLS